MSLFSLHYRKLKISIAFYYWLPEFTTVAELNQYLKAKINNRKFLKILKRYNICHYCLDKSLSSSQISLSWRVVQNDRYLFPTQFFRPLVFEGALNSIHLNQYHTGCHFAWRWESVNFRSLTPSDISVSICENYFVKSFKCWILYGIRFLSKTQKRNFLWDGNRYHWQQSLVNL